MCARYAKLFACTRIPFSGEDCHLVSPKSTHIVVMRGSHLYEMKVLLPNGSVLPESKFRDAFAGIISGKFRDSESAEGTFLENGNVPLGCFTAAGRPQWCEWRSRLEDVSARNRVSLQSIETALFTLSLDTVQPADRSHEMEVLLHGCHISDTDVVTSVEPRWHDKSIHIAIFPNGDGGLNFEHSPFDGATVVRMADEVYLRAVRRPTGRGELRNFRDASTKQLKSIAWSPRPLHFDETPQVVAALSTACRDLHVLATSNSTRLLHFEKFGKDSLKQLKCSPDGVIQAAIQLAYHRIHSNVHTGQWQYASAYESCSTKRYLWGRTEAIRPVTSKSTVSRPVVL